MTLSPEDRAVIDRYFAAMQAGEPALDALVALFADGGVLVEPFTGNTLTHAGKAAVREGFARSFRTRPPGMTLTLDGVAQDGDRIRSEWTVTAPAFPAPMRGADICTIRNGKIVRLEVQLGPPARGH